VEGAVKFLMPHKRGPSAELKSRENRRRWPSGWWFHCARYSCMERAVELRVLARPHVGPPMTVWVCKKHSLEIPDREQVA
jgi:hypothetical protein